jgi:hypothetical protein
LEHPDELHGEDAWLHAPPDATRGSFGLITSPEVAYVISEYHTGPQGVLYTTQTVDMETHFENLVFVGEDVPCAGIASATATGVGNHITCIDDWTGTVYPWYAFTYRDSPMVDRWGTAWPQAPVVDTALCVRDGVTHKLASELEGAGDRAWAFSCTPGVWNSPNPAMDFFVTDPTLQVDLFPAELPIEDNPLDTHMVMEHYPLNDQDPDGGYFEPITWAFDPERPIDPTGFVPEAGSVGVTCTPVGSAVLIEVAPGGSGAVVKTL